MQTTTYYGFEKPDLSDQLSPSNFNKNWDSLDGLLFNANREISRLKEIEIPTGGTTGQPLIKSSNNDNAVHFATLPVTGGGTGLTQQPNLQVNLSSTSAENIFAEQPRPGVTGVLHATNGGTGVASATKGYVFAAPVSADGVPGFRALAASDIPELAYLKLSGGTTTGDIHIHKASGNTFLYAKRIDANTQVGIGVGAGQSYNHGVWSDTLNKWITHSNKDKDVYVNEKRITRVSANQVFASPNGSTGDMSARALVAADIPALAASKITSGTFSADRIPGLNASKINAGTLADARISDGKWVKLVAGTNWGVYYRVRGGFCTIIGCSGKGGKSLKVETYETLGTLPAAARPTTVGTSTAGVKYLRFTGDTISNNVLLGSIGNDGALDVWHPKGGEYWEFSVTYPVG